ncbi:MAG: glycine--tRNA ligase [Candidatus Marinimicrobia bacterium]|nr:glycine--tRNA ligase [Candidatus Neomarinimicrobiota bacterium]|tara:strand:+ start:2292 stop:3599 length:1308 start_codon:yes stop_codon:yes gene_type:complete
MVENKVMDKLVSLCKRRGFIFQSSDIYGGLESTYDYGPLGAELKNNIKQLWWQDMVTSRPDVVGMDASILMNPKVWEASGHLSEFHDPMVDCKNCKARFRSDQMDLDNNCPNCGVQDWTEARQFNLMLKTHYGPSEDSSSVIYLRPETAQGIFVNFANAQSTARMKLPFGIAQIGKAFRNEITTGNFLFRSREFEQMEMEFFVKPDETGEWLDYWTDARMSWYKGLGIREERLKLRPHGDDELAHYAAACFDVEYQFPFGWSELEGIADRGTFDLDQHTEHSGKKLTWFDSKDNKHITPAVVEASAGVDRTVLTILVDAYHEEEVKGENRVVLRLSPKVAPTTVAVFPLVNRDGMPEIGEKIVESLRNNFAAFFDAGGSIGRRYRRQDEAGTPYGVTVDSDTLEDQTVTVRERDNMVQERVAIDQLPSYFREKIR